MSAEIRGGGVMLFCENIRALTAFYEAVLGLPRDPAQTLPPHKFVSFLDAEGNSVLSLHSGTKPNGGRQKLMWHVPSVEAVLVRLRATGVRKRDPAHRSGILCVDFSDPEGNRNQLYGPW